MELLAQKLINLEGIYLGTKYNDIVSFIRYAAKLKRIVLKCRNKLMNQTTNFSETMTFDVSILNKEREHLKNARKITIYAPDEIFVDFKLSTTNGNIDQRFVQIKRSDSFRWEYYSHF